MSRLRRDFLNLSENKNNDSWVNLKEGGKLTVKVGNGEQIHGMVPGLGSVSGFPGSTPWRRRCCVYGHKYIQVS